MSKKKLYLSDFDYELPRDLIAQQPAKPRDSSRLLVLHKDTGQIEHCRFTSLPDFLKKGDMLVMNDSMVFPARLIGKKIPGGGKIEIFLLRKIDLARGELKGMKNPWICLIGGRRILGQEVELDKGLRAKLARDNKDGTWIVDFNLGDKLFMRTIEAIGQVPLPPYIKRGDHKRNRADLENYQTVFADKQKKGSAAAPTAGLHFTPRLIKKLRDKGVLIEFITLHVGLGTFAAVKSEKIEDHKMHEEWVEVEKETMMRIMKTKSEGRRIIAVGTTSTRAIEAVFSGLYEKNQITTNHQNNGIIQNSKFKIQNSFKGWVNIFIYPGYRFKVIDGMITNFHLPKSTLLMLVSALAGKDKIDKAYRIAVENNYRFYSYGDGMLII